MLAHDPAARGSGLTRRGLIAAGGAATAAAVLAGPHATARAVGGEAGSGAPAHLRRSSYIGLPGDRFRLTAGAVATTVTLKSVSDLLGTKAGSDDAFALTFSGPRADGVVQGVKRVTHSELGTFELFVVPVDAAGAEQTYEAVINRSVGVPRQPPEAGSATSAEPPGRAPGSGDPREHRDVIRRASARRTPRGVTLNVVLEPDADVQQVAAWLVRGRRVLSTAWRRDVPGRRLGLRLRTQRPLRQSPHTVVIIASTADGGMTAKRVRVARRRRSAAS